MVLPVAPLLLGTCLLQYHQQVWLCHCQLQVQTLCLVPQHLLLSTHPPRCACNNTGCKNTPCLKYALSEAQTSCTCIVLADKTSKFAKCVLQHMVMHMITGVQYTHEACLSSTGLDVPLKKVYMYMYMYIQRQGQGQGLVSKAELGCVHKGQQRALSQWPDTPLQWCYKRL